MKEKEFFHHLHILYAFRYLCWNYYIKRKRERKKKKFRPIKCAVGLYISTQTGHSRTRKSFGCQHPNDIGPTLFVHTSQSTHSLYSQPRLYNILRTICMRQKTFSLIQRRKLLLDCLPSFFCKIYRKILCLYLRNINTFSFLSEKVTRKICLLEEKSLLFLFFCQFEFCENFPRGPSKQQ